MTKLHELAQRLPREAVLSKAETEAVKGGKRYRTSSYGHFLYVRAVVQALGYQTTTMMHGNEYCLEW